MALMNVNMMSMRLCLVSGLVIKLGVGIFFNPVSAQIIPDATLGSEGSRFIESVEFDRIEGGAARGVNLFHSFTEFNVLDGQQVYFANPGGIETILSRVTGGNGSDIFGTLGVLGNANLFLVNPNGIVFGPNARLDVAGSFVASTGNGFNFSDGSSFSATNPEAPPLLTMNVTPGLQYGASQPQAEIINQGNLRVGQDLTLVGNRLRLSGQLEAGRDLTLLATDTVEIRDSVSNPFIAKASGELIVQGNETVDIFALNHPDSGLFSGGDMVLRSANPVGGDAHYWSGGSFRIEQLDSSLGNLSSPNDPVIRASGDVSFDSYEGASLHIFAGGSVTVEDNITINDVDAENGIVETVTLSDGTTVEVDGKNEPTLDIRAGTIAFGTPGNPDNVNVNNPPGINGTGTSADINIGNININESDGLVLLTNQYNPNTLPGNITVDSISTSSSSGNSGSIWIDSRGDITLNKSIDSSIEESIDNALDSELFLFDSKGNLLTENDDSSTALGEGGSTSGLDSYIDYTFNQNGEYIIGVGQFPSEGTQGGEMPISGTPLTGNSKYTLQVSIENHAQGSGGSLTESEPNNSIQEAQKLDSSFLLQENPNVESSDTIPHVSIDGTGDNTFDYYSFEVKTPGSRGIFDIDDDNTSGGNAGNITINAAGSVLLKGSSISASSSRRVGNGGNIAIAAGNSVRLTEGATLEAQTNGSGNAGSVVVQALNGGSVSLENSRISTSVQKGASGDGDNIRIEAGSVSLSDKASIEAINNGSGVGGNIDITANTESVNLTDNAQINASTFGQGKGGSVTIRAISGSVAIANSSNISTTVELGATGSGGSINITAGAVSLTGGSRLEAQTRGQGNAGDIQISASDKVEISGTSQFGLSSGLLTSTETANSGEGGSISVRGLPNDPLDILRVSNGGFLSSRTNSISTGGSITVNVNQLEVMNGGQLITSAFSSGDAGNITVNAAQSVLLSGSNPNFKEIGDNITAKGRGTVGEQEGNDSIDKAQVIPLDNFSLQDNDDIEFSKDIPHISISGTGDGTFDYYSLEVKTPGSRGIFDIDNTSVDTELFLFDESRNLLAENDDSLTSSGGGGSSSGLESYISYTFATPATYILGVGRFNSEANNRTIEGEPLKAGDSYTLQLSLDNRNVNPNQSPNSGLFAQSQGTGQAGSIEITANQVLLDNQGELNARSKSGTGGNINLQVNDVLLMRNNSLISATAGNNGDGGNININAGFIVAVPSENSDIIANAFQGSGGQINIQANRVFGFNLRRERLSVETLRNNRTNDISASSESGPQGNINIQALTTDPSQELIELPTDTAAPQLDQTCSPTGSGKNEFTVTGRDGLPPSPTDILTPEQPLADLGTPINNTATQPTPTPTPPASPKPIVEAQGWIIDEQGNITLVANVPTANSQGAWQPQVSCQGGR
ncbi:MAG: filamentous hemagglutinin N-terminal domain-containing protein [Coleofasciculus sp. B1-GNL1-01]|uniref:two-partner secretion domain-containing protein n=1 Tax=Coleofasciculus sp. B1-GNL1-01 TaxID=3068484 RepID=UPI0032F60D61